MTRTIGRRGLQEYVGIEDGHGDEVRLPFGWWPRRGGWYPQPYFDPWLGDEASVRRVRAGARAVGRALPVVPLDVSVRAADRARVDARGVGHGLEQLRTATLRGGSETLDVAQQVTTGISCESCHLGGRAHATGTGDRIRPPARRPTGAGPVRRRAPRRARRQRGVRAVPLAARRRGSPTAPRCATRARRSISPRRRARPRAAPTATIRTPPTRTPTGRARRARDRRVHALPRPRSPTPTTARAHAGATATRRELPRLPHAARRDGHRPLRAHAPHLVADRRAHPRRRRAERVQPVPPRSLDRVDRERAAPPATTSRSRSPRTTRRWARAGSPTRAPRCACSPPPPTRARPRSARAQLPALVRGLTDRLAYVRAWTLIALDDLSGARLDYDVRAPSLAAAQRLLQQLQ